jgi:hypothetical protein
LTGLAAFHYRFAPLALGRAAVSHAQVSADSGLSFPEELVMQRLALSLGLLALLTASGCWRPYYGNRFGQPMYAQPAMAQGAVAQPTYSQPVVQSAPVMTQPQVIQSAPVQTYAQPYVQQQQQQCVPCQPNPCCVPCY